MDAFSYIGPWFLVFTVVSMYAFCFGMRFKGNKRWPPGHPWAPITLLLLATQQFVRVYHWDIGTQGNAALSTIVIVTAVLWIWTARKECRTATVETPKEEPDQGTKPSGEE